MEANIAHKGKTSEDGAYVIPSLPLGDFTVSASSPGFKAFQRTGVILEVSQRMRLDIVLEVGGAEVSRVATEESTLETVVERQRIEKLPLNGRHVFNLVKLVAGAQPRFRDQQSEFLADPV